MKCIFQCQWCCERRRPLRRSGVVTRYWVCIFCFVHVRAYLLYFNVYRPRKKHCATWTDHENVMCLPFKVKNAFLFFYKTSRTNNTVSITLIHDCCGGLCRGVKFSRAWKKSNLIFYINQMHLYSKLFPPLDHIKAMKKWIPKMAMVFTHRTIHRRASVSAPFKYRYLLTELYISERMVKIFNKCLCFTKYFICR